MYILDIKLEMFGQKADSLIDRVDSFTRANPSRYSNFDNISKYTNDNGDILIVDRSVTLESNPPKYNITINGEKRYIDCNKVNELVASLNLREA